MLASDQTVRLRPIAGIDAETVRVRPADLPSKPAQPAKSAQPAKPAQPLPPVISGMDARTVRHRIVDVAVKPLPSVIADRIPRTVSDRPSKWLVARVLLVLLLASMPILAIPVEVFGLVSQSTTSIVLIVLLAVLATFIVYAPHRIDMIVGRGLIAGMVAVHRLRRCPAVRRARPGADGRFHSRDGVVRHRRTGHRGQRGRRLRLALHRRRWRTWRRVLRRRVRAGHRPVVEHQSGARRGGLRRLPHLDRADRDGRDALRTARR